MERKYQIAGTSLVLTPEGEVLAAAYGPGAAQKFCDALNHERERALSAEARAERLAKVSAGYVCDGAGCIRNDSGEIVGHGDSDLENELNWAVSEVRRLREALETFAKIYAKEPADDFAAGAASIAMGEVAEVALKGAR